MKNLWPRVKGQGLRRHLKSVGTLNKAQCHFKHQSLIHSHRILIEGVIIIIFLSFTSVIL